MRSGVQVPESLQGPLTKVCGLFFVFFLLVLSAYDKKHALYISLNIHDHHIAYGNDVAFGSETFHQHHSVDVVRVIFKIKKPKQKPRFFYYIERLDYSAFFSSLFSFGGRGRRAFLESLNLPVFGSISRSLTSIVSPSLIPVSSIFSKRFHPISEM